MGAQSGASERKSGIYFTRDCFNVFQRYGRTGLSGGRAPFFKNRGQEFFGELRYKLI